MKRCGSPGVHEVVERDRMLDELVGVVRAAGQDHLALTAGLVPAKITFSCKTPVEAKTADRDLNVWSRSIVMWSSR